MQRCNAKFFAGGRCKLSKVQTDLREAVASLQKFKPICGKPLQACKSSKRFAGSFYNAVKVQIVLREAFTTLQRLPTISGALQTCIGYGNFIALQACNGIRLYFFLWGEVTGQEAGRGSSQKDSGWRLRFFSIFARHISDDILSYYGSLIIEISSGYMRLSL
ncbi:MAG: hypothetical protein LBD21_08150 [Tannerellaceae bacterium]|jgi:hypothetical protein|nr:hypothetical protein [Tannerellaceae bacterium]